MQSNSTSPERELELVECLKTMSVSQIIREKQTSGRLLNKLRRKHGLWGA